MPKILVAGEKRFAVHSFSDEDIENQAITETRAMSVVKIGKVFDLPQASEDQLNTIRDSLLMLLKQSATYKRDTDEQNNSQNNSKASKPNGFVVTVFRGKNKDGKKSYIATWLGRMAEEGLTQNPEVLVQQLVNVFNKNYSLKEYHKNSVIHQLMGKK